MGSTQPAAAEESEAGLGRPLPSEWRVTEVEDERFLPTLEAEASEIVDGLWLGSEANALDVVWLKVQKIGCVITINSHSVDPVQGADVSEALKLWFCENVEHAYFEALDTPTQMVTQFFRPVTNLIDRALDAGRKVLVHCGRGISRSATLVIAALMHRDGLTYTDALGLVSSRRACVYPNVGFQLQLCLFEQLGFAATEARFDPASEVAISIGKTLTNVTELLDAVFDDEAARLDPSRWMDFGFFFQNCREYLGHVDIGLPLDLLAQADDVARRLRNLEVVFEGMGIATAGRLGRVMDVWQGLQARMAAAPGALPRLKLAGYVSVLGQDTDGEKTKSNARVVDHPASGSDRSSPDNDEPDSKRRRAAHSDLDTARPS